MQKGSTLPSVPVQQLSDGGVLQINLAEYSAGKSIVLVGLPGAFTPTCSDDHLPGYIANVNAFREKGIDSIVVLATSDFFVVKAWADMLNADPMIRFMADGSQNFAKAAGLELDLSGLGLGMRTQRYAAIIRDGRIEELFVERDVTAVTGSAAKVMLKLM